MHGKRRKHNEKRTRRFLRPLLAWYSETDTLFHNVFSAHGPNIRPWFRSKSPEIPSSPETLTFSVLLASRRVLSRAVVIPGQRLGSSCLLLQTLIFGLFSFQVRVRSFQVRVMSHVIYCKMSRIIPNMASTGIGTDTPFDAS